jgi:membrane-anchored protein YejM (alkaline phosphatase superfamily)
VVSSPPNIVIIGIDAWRADCFNAIDTPNLWQFAQQGIILHNHKSGANHTSLGLFSLFYAIPSTYHYNFSKKLQSPLFIDRLQQLDYQIMFSFAGRHSFKGNGFDKTIFSKIPTACFNSIGEVPSERDISINNGWLDWYDNRNVKKPHFSFLFYHSVHDNDFPSEFNKNYTPTKGKYKHKDFVTTVGKQGFISAYKTSVQYVDSLIAKVIQKLTAENDLTNTIIIITSDHGREFDDNHQGCWTNGSNFTDCQIKVPCAIIGPKFNALKDYWKKDDLTTHYDIIPTIMKNFLGVENDVADYSIGINLLDKNNLKRDWLFVTNSLRHSMPCAIIDENTIFQWFPTGFYQIFNKQNHHIFTKTINKQRLAEAIDMMTRFLK